MGERELAMVDAVEDIPTFATDEEAAAFWTEHWAGPRLVAQLERSDRFAAEVGRD